MSSEKWVLVTGGNRGLGLATAQMLAQQHGYCVLLGARDIEAGAQAAEELQSQGLTADALQLDVADESSVAALHESVRAVAGQLDALVNCAGIMLEHTAEVSSSSLQMWRDTFEVNLFGAVAVTQALLPLLLEAPCGRIVNVSAILGSLTEISKPAMRDWIRASYTASKAALNAYTISLAQQYRETPLKINAVHPGWAKTAMGGPKAPMTVEQAARNIVAGVMLPDDGPTGSFFHNGRTVNW